MTCYPIMMQQKDRIFIETAKKEFIYHHPEFEMHHISNRKIIYEALKYYILTGKYKPVIQDFLDKNINDDNNNSIDKTEKK